MRRLALIGDSHGNYEALKTVIADAKSKDVTDYIVLGDITNRGPEPLECVQALKELDPLIWIIGNHEAVYHSLIIHDFKDFADNPKAIMAVVTSAYDRQYLGKDLFKWLSTRPFQTDAKLENVKFNVFHATPTTCRGSFSFPTMPESNFDEMMAKSNADVGIYGHTHRFILRMTTDGRYIFNPGSVGMPVSTVLSLQGKASYGILEIEDHSILKWEQLNVPYDIEKEIQTAQKRRLPYFDLYCELLKTGRFTFDPAKVRAENIKHDYLKKALKDITTIDW